ncbi:unnamed protein product [Adineta steineri]|uniref:VWFA domain-containing protein n=1 Tax=Adineta steineri TaxID=433720 RepID=A0A818HA48_9BILA|nr:unnamed protein product [Adineta steineri]CAF3504717.1 unnamed protein product [Adineta steineri]
MEHPRIKDIWTTKTSLTVKVEENHIFNEFKNELKLLWEQCKVDNELDFNRVAQQLFDEDMEVLEEIKEYTLDDDFTRFKYELNKNEKFRKLWQAKKQFKSNVIDYTFMKFKVEMIKMFEIENVQLDQDVLETLLQQLYENDVDNIADFFKNKVIPKKVKQLIVKIQSNETLKTIWTSNMLIFSSIRSILDKYLKFTDGDNDDMLKIISELYVKSEYGMKLIESKCSNEIFNKVKSDLYDNAEIRSKVFHEKNVVTSINDITPVHNTTTVNAAIRSNTNDNKDELNIIISCVQTESNLFQLEDLVQAGEMQYINETLKDIAEELVEKFHSKHQEFPTFIRGCLTPIMYLSKRLQNLDDFLNTLMFTYQRIRQKTNYQLKETTNISLRMLLHVLFLSSDTFLRRIIMSLVSKRNPVPFVSPNIRNWSQNEQYEFMPAIIHVWNYTRPTILSFGIGPCQGKSALLNQLFQSTFEQRVDSIYFDRTIDIDFGYCFNPERALNIADTHGQIDTMLLKKIEPLFDGFLVQINKAYLDIQPQNLLEYIKCLSHEKFQIIIVRDVPNQNLQEYSSKIQTLLKQPDFNLSQKLHIHPLINSSNTNDRNTAFIIENLREEILTKIKEDIAVNTERKDDILPILQKLVKQDYVAYLKKMNKIIQPLKKRLLEKNEYQNNQNFPLYLKFQELCKARQKLKKLDFYGSESENMFDINSRLSELETELDPNTKTSSPIKCGYIFDSFIEILKSDNMLMSLDLLAAELKSELSSLGGDKIAGNLAVQHAFLSLEVLWRNAIVCYYHTTLETQHLITKSYHDYVAAGFPFEIIDGDNFHFQQKFLTNILGKFASDRILVISIIGPQNSGKSTLLNYMFGTLFDVREGRCTRGIYGSLVKLPRLDQGVKSNLGKILNANISDIDYLLLIDTEGLLSIEKGDKEYDRRLVLFSLSVSHLVIVNMMGDINETLKDMLTLCADSLKQIGVNTTNQPMVHFVLNQKADPNLKNHMEAIEKIVIDLKEKELAEVIQISSKTFHTLPSAFKKERVSTDTKSPCFLRTEPDFIERTQQLCEKIIESATTSYGRSGDMFSNPPQWLKTAVNIFDTLQKFPDLTYFKDINERRQDDQIRKEIGELLSATLSASYRQKMIKDTCERTEYEIQKHFQAEFDVHQDNFDNTLENIFKVANASDRIRDRCRQFLKRQVTEICNAWCTASIQAHDQKQMEGLVRDGSADLRKLIDEIIKNGNTMTEEEATREFEYMWKKKNELIKSNFKPEERLRQAITFVYGNYNIFEKQCLPSHELVLGRLQFIIDLSKKADVHNVTNSILNSFVRDTFELQQSALEVLRRKSDTNVAYTLATLDNFKHLNGKILTSLYLAGTTIEENSTIEPMDQGEPNTQCHKQAKKISSSSGTVMSKVRSAVKYAFNPSSAVTPVINSTAATPTPLAFNFMKAVQNTILGEIPTASDPVSNILNISEFFDKIIKDIMMIVHGNDITRRPIEIDLVQKIVGLINTHINEINLELLVFNLSISKQIKSSIHLYVLILLTIFYYDEQKHHFSQQLSTLDEQKSSLLTYFISMIVTDAQCDKEGAELFANQVRSAIQSSLVRDAQKIITHAVQAQQNLSRKQIQTICDGKLQGAVSNNQWLFRYIQVPTDIIVEEFKILWKQVETTIDQEIQKEKYRWRSLLSEFFNRIEFMMSAVKGEGSSVQYIDDIFEASGGSAADNLTNKGQCMVLLLYAYLSGNKIETGTSYTVFNKKYTLKAKGLRLFEKLLPPSQQLTSLIKEMNNIDGRNNTRMAIAAIKNLHLFLESTVNVKKKVQDAYDGTPATFAVFDKDQIYNKLLDKARGCTSKCPCCDRPCDVDHSLIKSNAGDEDNRHSCQTGHQLRAMAGIKFEVTNEASLFQCEQMEDDKPIIVRGTRKKWSEFKNDHLDWDFGNSITPDDLFKLRGKFLNVWSKIGKRLCEKYDMKFVTENTPQAGLEPFHYILLLDASGSMRGTPWEHLLDGVEEFIKIRVDSGALDRMTIIVFDYNAKYAYFNVDIKAVDLATIQFTNGRSTNFCNAFDLVVKTIQSPQLQISFSNSTENLDFIIIFMSDGQAECPNTQLSTLLTMKIKIRQFWTVALGKTQMHVLEEINQRMNGTFRKLEDSADLVHAYGEIAK